VFLFFVVIGNVYGNLNKNHSWAPSEECQTVTNLINQDYKHVGGYYMHRIIESHRSQKKLYTPR
jgi:hypothetical protein